MKQEELRELKARAQRLETLVQEFSNDVELLYKNGIDVSDNDEIAERQSELQDEIEQVVSDLLAVLDQSDSLESDERQIDLPNVARRPVSDASLPESRIKRTDKNAGAPLWVKGHEKANNNGSNNNPNNGD